MPIDETVDKGQTAGATASDTTTITPTNAEQVVKEQTAYDDAFAPEKPVSKGTDKSKDVVIPKPKSTTIKGKKNEPVKKTADVVADDVDDKTDKVIADADKDKTTEKTAQQKLQDRADKAEGKQTADEIAKVQADKVKADAQAKVEADKVAQEKAKEVKPPFKLTPEISKEFHDDLANDPDMKQFASDYPDEFKVITTAMMKGATKVFEKMGMGGATAPTGDFVSKQEIQDIRGELAHYKFMQDVSRKHPDVQEITGSKEWNEWIDKQPNGVKKLASSNDADDAGYVLDAYKEATGKLSAQQEVEKARATKAKKDALLEDDDGAGSDNSTTKTGEDKNDFGAGFDE